MNRASDGKAISLRDGDVVSLSVKVQLREANGFDAEILAEALLQEEPRQDFAASNRYDAWFKPPHDGAYACVEDPQTFPGKPPAGYRNNNKCGLD
jgi:hypothetical protein